MAIKITQLHVLSRTIIITGGSIANAGLAGLALVLASRQGQQLEIASYIAATSAMVIAATLVSGGASLRYVSGTDTERSALIRRRIVFALPALGLAAVAVVLVYVGLGLPAAALAFAAGSVWLNNASELPLAHCHVANRYGIFAVAPVLSKLLAVILILDNHPLSFALLLGNLVQIATVLSLLGRSFVLRVRGASQANWGDVSEASTRLTAFGESGVQRAGLLVASLASSPVQLASLGVLVSITQAAGSTLALAGYPLAVRQRRVTPESHHLAFGLMTVAVGGSLLLVLLSRKFVDLVGVSTTLGDEWLAILAVGIPFYLWNRLNLYSLSSKQDYASVAKIPLTTLAIQLTLYVAMWPILSSSAIPIGTVMAEMITTVWLTLRGRRRA